MLKGITKEEFEAIVKKSKTYTEILKLLKKGLYSGNHRTIKNYIKLYGIDDSHLLGQAWRRGQPRPPQLIREKDLKEYLKEDTVVYANFKRRLIKEEYFEHKCYTCGLTEWDSKPIPIQLHHINGNRFDNRLENLTLLCPNCHSTTSNYGAKNIRYNKEYRNYIYSISKQELEKVYETKTLLEISLDFNIPYKILCSLKKEYGIKTKNNSKDSCIGSCKDRPEKRKFNPSKEELSDLVYKMPTSKVAKIYNVSDKAVEKRCKRLRITKPPRGYWAKMNK